MDSYPPAPWRLRGHAILVPVRRTGSEPAAHADDALPTISLGPFSPGFLIVARYGEGSSLRYDEAAILAPVRSGWRLGFRVRRIWVDDAASVRGGREIWGLEKELAAFDWKRRGRDGRVAVQWGDGSELVVRWTGHGPILPAPYVPVPRVFIAGAEGVRRFRVGVRGRVRWATPGLAGDLDELGLRGPRLAPAVRFERVEATAFPPEGGRRGS